MMADLSSSMRAGWGFPVRLRVYACGTAVARYREERIERSRLQAIRRMKNRELAVGMNAWLEFWEAKRYALAKLRKVGNKMKSPDLTNAFNQWYEDLEEEKRVQENSRTQREARRLVALCGVPRPLWRSPPSVAFPPLVASSVLVACPRP